jgi:hypothetical protein
MDQPPPLGPGVISVDPGIRHFALTVYDPVSRRVRVWELFDARAPSAGTSAAIVCDVLQQHLPSMSGCSVVVVERQPGRDNRPTTLVEGAVAGFFHAQGLQVLHKDTRFKWTAMPDHDYGQLRPAERKRITVAAARTWLDANPQLPELMFRFDAARKKDDLADSLVQALAQCEEHIHFAAGEH